MPLRQGGAEGIVARCAPFAGCSTSGADLVLAAADALAAIERALDGSLFETLRARAPAAR